MIKKRRKVLQMKPFVIYRTPERAPSRELVSQREYLAWQLRARGFTQAGIAVELKKNGLGDVTQSAVMYMLRRIEKRLLSELSSMAEREKLRQDSALSFLLKECIDGYEHSKLPTESDGASKEGNLEFIDRAFKALEARRRIWGAETPVAVPVAPVNVQVNNITPPSRSLSEMIQIAAEIEAKKMATVAKLLPPPIDVEAVLALSPPVPYIIMGPPEEKAAGEPGQSPSVLYNHGTDKQKAPLESDASAASQTGKPGQSPSALYNHGTDKQKIPLESGASATSQKPDVLPGEKQTVQIIRDDI